MDYNQLALELHEKNQGKIQVTSKITLSTKEDLSTAYTPGVAEPCRKIADNPKDVYKYTAKGNLVAVISDGSAVLGLGNIGAEAAIPVMEGKAILFQQFAGVNAFPLCLNTQDTEELVETIARLAPSFGGINLEDIASPRCFEVEKRLEELLDIPVFHDDQHGTAIVVTAGVLNAAALTGRKLEDLRVVINGPGAAGTAIIKMLLFAGVKHLIACDEHGILHRDRQEGLTDHKVELAEITNPDGMTGSLAEALVGANLFVGVSVPRALTAEMIKTMAPDPIVFAMANPVPEIMYEEAVAAGVKVMGTGRSDMPNQINNVLAFPGVFRGALDVGARDINDAMKFAAAQAIAGVIPREKLATDYIIPSIFDETVTSAVAQAVAETARKTGACRI